MNHIIQMPPHETLAVQLLFLHSLKSCDQSVLNMTSLLTFQILISLFPLEERKYYDHMDQPVDKRSIN